MAVFGVLVRMAEGGGSYVHELGILCFRWASYRGHINLWQEVKTKEPLWSVLQHGSKSTEGHVGHGLKAFQASFNAPNTPLAIILCSNVVFLTLSYENDSER